VAKSTHSRLVDIVSSATDLASSPTLVFRYRAAQPDGSIESGTVSASSATAAARVIAGRGQWVLDVRPAPSDVWGRRALSPADLGLGLRLLAALLQSGLPVARALSAWEDVAPDAWRPALPAIQEAVQHGESFGTALASSPLGVPPVVIGIIRAGEAGSGLADAVRRAAVLMESAAATRAAIRAALAYPLILAAAGSASIALLVGVVLPRFATILTDLGQTLPATTRSVLAVADAARAGAIPGAVGASLLAALWYRWSSSESGQLAWHRFLLGLPLIGDIRRSAATARYAQTLSALIECGVPIGAALRSAANAVGDAAIADGALRARDRVVRGERLATSLGAEAAATPTTLKIIRAGEDSGRLAEMLAHAAAIEQERASRAVANAVRLLEPALILAFGGLVAFVAAALLQAVYSVRPGA
jgi:general secretion pathway protein F